MDQTATLPERHPLPLPEDLQQAARHFFPDAGHVAPLARDPAAVKVSAPSGDWRVRRWPEGTPLSDVTFSHEVIALARGAGLTVVPELFTAPSGTDSGVFHLAGRIYDAQRWLPGTPPANAQFAWPEPEDRIDAPAAIASGAFLEVTTTLARIHEATSALAATRGIPTAPLHMLPGAVRQAQSRQLSALRPRARYEPTIQRWLAAGERLMATAEPLVNAGAEECDKHASVLHLNLWPAHVLLDHGALSGLLGWERVAAGSPLLDVAQATLRLQGWSDESVEAALGAYGEIRRLTPEERRLLPAVAALDAVATTGRLLEQAYITTEFGRPPSALRAAVDMMLRSMTALDRNLNVLPQKSRRRTWNRSMPRPRGRDKGGAPRERRR